MPSDYEDSLGVQGSEIGYSDDSIKISNIVGFCGDKIKEAFSFSADGTFNKFNIDYINKKIRAYVSCTELMRLVSRGRA